MNLIDKVAQALKDAGLNCVNIKDKYPQALAKAAVEAIGKQPTVELILPALMQPQETFTIKNDTDGIVVVRG